uniref:ATP-dependent zinc metalloprotease FtsH n=1 Tax=Cryptomonas sp. CCAC 1634B TaxID=2051848 RepID=A0A679CB27_9CRYP|nr:cell division protein ftsH [Cryptomonas sp. CCAC 1634B]
MKTSWKSVSFWVLPIFVAVCFSWQGFTSLRNIESGKNASVNKITYGRFLEYLDKGWVRRMDIYDNGHTGVVEMSQTMSTGVLQYRVNLPSEDHDLILKLHAAGVNLTAYPSEIHAPILGMVGITTISITFLGGLAIFFRRSNGMQVGSNQVVNFGKSKARFSMEIATGITFEDVAGADEAKEEFREVVSFLKHAEKFVAVGAKIPRGIMLVGPPGTGKTLLAKAIAGEACVPFFSISGSEFVEMFVGVGASRVRDLFKKAKENSPCIVFIDEIDAVGRQRGTGVGGGNDEREQTLNQLLTEMDGFEGSTGIIVIAATNRVDVLDGALLRPGRFDRQVSIGIPDIKGRIAILNVHARNKKISEEVSLEVIAKRTPGFSGADLANLLNEGAILAVRRQKRFMTMSDIDISIDRVVAGMEGTTLIDSRTKRLVAYHEVGHAVLGTLVPHHSPVQKVTLIPRGYARGLTWFIPSENPSFISKAHILATIIGALGGRVTEEVVFGSPEVTIGATNDLQQVTSMARYMVTRFGMSDIGPVSLETQHFDPFLGKATTMESEYSEDLASNIDRNVRSILQECRNKATHIISTHRVAIDMLVDLLLEKETLSGEEFRAYLLKCSTPKYELPLRG